MEFRCCILGSQTRARLHSEWEGPVECCRAEESTSVGTSFLKSGITGRLVGQEDFWSNYFSQSGC